MDTQSRIVIEQLQQRLQELEQRNRELEERVRDLEAENGRLREQVDAAERAAARQAAPFRRREKGKVPESEKKKPGRKPGHPGAYRAVPPQIDDSVDVPLPCCPQCGGPVHEVAALEQFIEEIPPVRPHVTRLVTYQGVCARCGEVASSHPLQTSTAGGAAKVQLGPRACALATQLNKDHGLTTRTTCAVLRELVGLRLTPGGLVQNMARSAARVESNYERLVDDIRSSDAVFADETSWYVGEPGWWLWGFTTAHTTVYIVDQSRGSDVVAEVLGEAFAGMLVSDCLSTYDPIDCRKHKCIAHHLKAISKARDRPDTTDPSYLDQWKLFFSAVIGLWRARPNMSEARFAAGRAGSEAWCDRLLAEVRTQSGDLAIRNRLSKQRAHLLGCLYEPAAEPTNNRAERVLRPAVIARKLSCGNKTTAGKRTFEVLKSLAVTCAQRGQDFVHYLASHLPLVAPRIELPAPTR